MATNQSSNKENGTSKTGTKKTTTRTSTGTTRSASGNKTAAGTKSSGTAKTGTAAKAAPAKASGTTRAAPSAGRKTSSTARTSIGGRTVATGKTAGAAKTAAAGRSSAARASSAGKTESEKSVQRTAPKSVSAESTSQAKKVSAVSSATLAGTAAGASSSSTPDLFSNTPYTSPSVSASGSSSAAKSSVGKSAFSDDVADYLGSSTRASSDYSSGKTSSEAPATKTESSSYSPSYTSAIHDMDESSPQDENPSGGNSYGNDDDDKKEKKSKALPIILISSGVVLMAGIGTSIAVNSNGRAKAGEPAPGAEEYSETGSALSRENTLSLASLYIDNGDYDQAVLILSSYLSENPADEDARELLEKAQLLNLSKNGNGELSDDILSNFDAKIKNGDYDGAAEYIRNLPEESLSSQGVDGNNLIGKAEALSDGRDLLNKGEYEKAGNVLDSYLSTNPRDPDVESMLASVRRLEALANKGLNGAETGNVKDDLSAPETAVSSARASEGGDLASIITPDNSQNRNVYTVPGTASNNSSNVSSNNNTPDNASGSSSSSGREPSVTVLNQNGNQNQGSGSSPANASSGTGAVASNNGRTPSTESSSTPAPSSPTGRFTGIDSMERTSPSSSSGTKTASTGSTPSSSGNGTTTTSPSGTKTASTGTSPSSSGSGTTTASPSGTKTVSTGSTTTSPSGTKTASTGSTPSSSGTSQASSLNPSARSNSDIGGRGSLSGLLSTASSSGQSNAAVGNDGTKTSPEVLLKKYGTRAITRKEALEVGNNFIDDGKYDECINLMNELLTLNPKDSEAKKLLDEARTLKQKNGGNGGARTTDQNLALAEKWINGGNYDDAITLLNSILSKDPDNERAKALLEKAQELKNNKNPEKDALKRAEKLSEAMRLINEGKYDEAQAILNQLLSDNPNDTQARNLLEQAEKKKERQNAENNDRLAKAKDALKDSDYKTAIDMLNEILKNDPDNEEAKKLLAQAKALEAQNQKDKQAAMDKAKKDLAEGNPEDAIKALEKYLAEHPDDKEAQKLLDEAKKAQAQKDKERADKIAEAKRLMEKGEYDKAAEILKALSKDNPDDKEISDLLKKANEASAAEIKDTKEKLSQAKKDIDGGDYEKAIAALNQILKDDPNNAEAKKLLKEAEEKKNAAKVDQAKKDINSGNYDKAISALEALLKEDPDNAEAKKLLEEAKAKKAAAEKEAAAKAKVDQAKKDINSGNYDKAISALEALLKEDPNNAEAKKLLEEAKAKKAAAEEEKAKAKDRTDNLAKARSLINNGDYDEAIKILNDLLKDNPNDTQAKNLLTQAQTKKAAAERDRANKLAKARTDIDNGNYDSAISSMNGLLKTNPDDADAKKLLDEATAKKNAAAKDRSDKLAQAQKLIDAGDYEGAAKILNGLVGSNGNDAQAKALLDKANKEKAAAEQAAAEKAKQTDLNAVKQKVEDEISQGKAAIAKGNANDALSHFAAAKDLLSSTDDPYAAEKLGEMAKALYDAAQNAADATTRTALNNAAAQYAAEAVAKNPNNAPGHYVVGMQALAAKNYAKAEQELTLATKQDPTNGIYWYQLGRVQAMQQKYSAAATSFKNAIKYEPTLASAYYNLGYVQEKSGNPSAALESYKNAYKVDTKYEKAYIAAARIMANSGDYNGAVTAFASAIKVNPSNAQTYQEQGSAYANMGDYKSAENCFRRALAYMDPSKPDAATYYNLSSVLLELEKYSEGVNYAALAYNNKAGTSSALQVNIIYNYGLLSEKTGEKNRAISLYNEALALDPNHVKSKINLGALYIEKGDADSALKFLNEAYAKVPDNFEVNNNLGNAYKEKGEYSKAVIYYQSALKINPTDNTVRENLAKAYASSGQFSNAKMTYEDVIAADPENWGAYLECAKTDMSLGDTKDAIEKLEYLQQHNPSYARTEVSTLLYSLK